MTKPTQRHPTVGWLGLASSVAAAVGSVLVSWRTGTSLLQDLEYEQCAAVAPVGSAPSSVVITGWVLLVAATTILVAASRLAPGQVGRWRLAVVAMCAVAPLHVAAWRIYLRGGSLGDVCSNVWASSPWPWSFEIVLASGVLLLLVCVLGFRRR